jgi:hypothetical protein
VNSRRQLEHVRTEPHTAGEHNTALAPAIRQGVTVGWTFAVIDAQGELAL